MACQTFVFSFSADDDVFLDFLIEYKLVLMVLSLMPIEALGELASWRIAPAEGRKSLRQLLLQLLAGLAFLALGAGICGYLYWQNHQQPHAVIITTPASSGLRGPI